MAGLRSYFGGFIFLFAFTGVVSNNESLTHCQSISMKDGTNQTYCGITKEWTPRHSTRNIIIACFTFGGLACLAACFSVCCYLCKSADGFSMSPITRCFPIGKLLWDVVDVILDGYTYYKLDQGLLIDSKVYRNDHVLNGILAFTFLGAIKTILVSFLFCSFAFGDGKEKKHVMQYKRVNIHLTFVLEDGIEMFLEYYWIERYFTHSPPVYMIARDAFLLLMAIYGVFDACLSDGGITIFVFIAELLRIIGAVYQYEKGVFNRDCLTVNDGMLIQTPFTSGCLRGLDYAIIFFIFFAFAFLFFCWSLACSTLETTKVEKPNKKADTPYERL